MTSAPVTIYTVGHGRHPWAEFLALLREYRVELVCDVRSAARSRWPQFNGRVLEDSLRAAGIGYEWLPECGGKVIAPTEELNRGFDRIMELASEAPVGLLGPPLRARGARLIHILPGGGSLEVDESSLPSIW